ncbi:MAG: universal stress protein [Candidatus Sumerlaeia bacterium]|nr:universal stress protein [Candidatus Sumerlaeia bacterium]
MAWFPKKMVVVPIDLSDFSLMALDVALDFVEDASHLHVIHVLREMSPMEPGVVWGEIDDTSRRIHAEEAIRTRLADPKYNGIVIHILFGNPGNQIARYAEQRAADLIVIHSHGRTGAAHLLIGSVAERVVRHAHCPVLVIRD